MPSTTASGAKGHGVLCPSVACSLPVGRRVVFAVTKLSILSYQGCTLTPSCSVHHLSQRDCTDWDAQHISPLSHTQPRLLLISLTSILPRVSCLIHRLIHLCFPGNRARSPASLKRAAESKLARLCGRDIVGLSPPYHSPLEDYQRRDEARGLKVDNTRVVPLRHLHFNKTIPHIIATPATPLNGACPQVPCLASRTSCLRDRHNTPP